MTSNLRELKEKQYRLKREIALRKASLDFYPFAVAKDPILYKDDRQYLVDICNTLQAVSEGRKINPKTGKAYRKVMFNMPPRHGKSRTVTLLTPWLLGRNQDNRIISVSYNEKLSRRFSRSVRNTITEDKKDPLKIIYNDIFKGVEIQRGDASAQLWSLKEQYFNFLGASPNATMTGIGCNIGIIDDLIKTSKEALNDRVLDDQWEWYTDTFLSRLEANAVQILIGTRWNTKDIFGRLLDKEPDEWLVIEYEAYYKSSDTMLCPEILPKDEYDSKKRLFSAPIFLANYHNRPVDFEGRLYKQFKTYRPEDIRNIKFEKIIFPVDTADKGTDYFCAGPVGVYEGQGYILSVLFTQEGMEFTEPKSAEMLYKFNVNSARVESQAGGEGYVRSVKRILWEKYQTRKVSVKAYPQRQNKLARIRDNATWVMENIYFPFMWASDYPEFHRHIIGFLGNGKDENDDGADWLTMIAEEIETKKSFRAW